MDISAWILSWLCFCNLASYGSNALNPCPHTVVSASQCLYLLPSQFACGICGLYPDLALLLCYTRYLQHFGTWWQIYGGTELAMSKQQREQTQGIRFEYRPCIKLEWPGVRMQHFVFTECTPVRFPHRGFLLGIPNFEAS